MTRHGTISDMGHLVVHGLLGVAAFTLFFELLLTFTVPLLLVLLGGVSIATFFAMGTLILRDHD